MKKMYRTTAYLFTWFMILLLSIKYWDGICLLFIRLYPLGIFIIIFFVVLFVKLYLLLLNNCINKDITYKCKNIIKNVKDSNKEKINKLIIENNKNNYMLLFSCIKKIT